MIVPLSYRGTSSVVHQLRNAEVALATNTSRETVYFRGTLRSPLAFREGLAALHAVVASDFSYRPRERAAYRRWLEEQDRKFLVGLAVTSEADRQRHEQLEVRRAELERRRLQRLQPFSQARDAYLRFAATSHYEQAYLLDPVVTVHPDQVFFEVFSRDESSYARLSLDHEAFETVDAIECGTTNVDFSRRLASEFSRMRSYRRTVLEVGPKGVAVAAGTTSHRERKIELPDSWLQGFLQVHCTMALAMVHFELAPIELFNLCRALSRRRAKVSPRALRFELRPGEPVTAVLEPWELRFPLQARYDGSKALDVRTWGRERLLTLERILPVADRIDVYLAGFGLPTFYVLRAGGISFSLALSGWTDNDWSGGARFDLLTRRLTASAEELLSVYEALRETRASSDEALAAVTKLSVEKVRSVLSHLCQVGRAMFDLATGVYRHRDIFPGPLTLSEAKQAVAPASAEVTPVAKTARQILATDNVRIIARRPFTTAGGTPGFKVSGSARGNDGKRVRPLVAVDQHGQIIEATCTCPAFRDHKLTKGPCEHVLALRLAHMGRLEVHGDGPVKGGGHGS